MYVLESQKRNTTWHRGDVSLARNLELEGELKERNHSQVNLVQPCVSLSSTFHFLPFGKRVCASIQQSIHYSGGKG